jgi:hypothetical protein
MKKIAIIVVLVALSTPAIAGPEEDNIRYIEDYLYRIKDKLDGIVGDSSSSDIDYAFDNLNYVKDYTERLKSLNPQNDPGKSMAYYYPDYISKFRESLQYLKRMKDAQVKADESRLHERCYEADRNLKSFMQGFIEKKDPNSLSKISDEAEKIGRQFNDEYRRMQEIHNEMDRWRSYARNFSESHGRWSDVRGELHDGVSDIWDRWTRRMDETKAKCQQLAKGRDYDAVKDALAKLGDSNRARAAIIEKLNQQLDQTSNYLSAAGARTGTSEIDYAMSQTSELSSQLEMLRNARGEDDNAKRITDSWPERTKELRRSLELIKQVKQQQFSFDKIAEGCKVTEDQLMGTLRAYIGNPDEAEEGARVGTERAERFGNETRQTLEAAQRKLDEQQRLLDEAKRFSFTEGRWSGVKDRLHETANAMFTHMKSKLDESKTACGKLAQGPNNPDVRDGIKKLNDFDLHVKTTLERTQKEYDQWKIDRRALKPKGRFRQENADKLLQAFCDTDELQLADRVKRVADEVAATLGATQNLQLEKIQRLLGDLEKVSTTKNPALQKEVRRQRTNMTAAKKRLEEAGSRGILRGRNNPMINMYLENGNTKHRALQTGCTAMEYAIPGGRIDCLIISDGSCEVIEVKPNSDTGKSAGQTQLEHRKKTFDEQFKDGKLQEIVKRCVKDGKLNIEYKLRLYQYCPVGIEQIDVTDEPMDE